mgnify:CR=1 FL=1
MNFSIVFPLLRNSGKAGYPCLVFVLLYPLAVNVICLVAEKVEELGIYDCHDEIEGSFCY